MSAAWLPERYRKGESIYDDTLWPPCTLTKQADDGTSVEEVCRKAGISQQTYYRWRKKYAGLMPSELRRLKQLEEENSRLKRTVADLSLDKEMLQAA